MADLGSVRACGTAGTGRDRPRARRPPRRLPADRRLGQLGVNVGTYGMEPWILDDAKARQLWELSEQLVGDRFF